jgi:hypothetical protein
VPQAGRKFSRYLDKVSWLSQSLINVIIGSPEAMELYIYRNRAILDSFQTADPYAD